MANNTGNPIGSTAAKDLSDNAQNLDKFANGNDYEYADRLGRSRKSLKWIEDAALAIPAIDAAIRSEEDAKRSELAANVAAATTNLKPTIADGLAATAGTGPDNRFFSVPSTGSLVVIAYLNDGGVPVEIGGIASSKAIEEIGIEEMDSDLTDLLYGVLDKEGNRTSMEIGLDGRPTDFSAACMGEKLTGENSPALLSAAVAASGFEEIDDELNDLSFGIAGKDGGLTFLAANLNGDPTADSAARIFKKLPIRSGPNILCAGDSMTQGNQDGTGVTYPDELQKLLSAAGHPGAVTNFGAGGETSVTITARAGGNPFVVLPVGGVIPATTGAVQITLLPINGAPVDPLKQGPSTYIATLAGVRGTFSRTIAGDVFTYYFTRFVAGTEIPVNRPEPMYLEIAEAARGDIAVIWMGQNGPNTDRAIQDAEAIISHMKALDKRFIVISMPGGSSAQDADDSKWFAKFGRRFIPIRQYMAQYGLADAGITPTAQDLADMTNGTVPTSLRTDAVHWIGEGYKILAKQIFKRMKELEFI